MSVERVTGERELSGVTTDLRMVDDLFFFVEGEGATIATLFVDEVVIFDAAPPASKRPGNPSTAD